MSAFWKLILIGAISWFLLYLYISNIFNSFKKVNHLGSRVKFLKEESLQILTYPQLSFCSNESRINSEITTTRVLAFIYSSRDHFTARNLIRTTWGQKTKYTNIEFNVIFVLGSSSNNDVLDALAPGNLYNEIVNNLLDSEIMNYGDILIGNFTDSYRNLVLKHIYAYKWILENCSNIHYVLKTDDDVFIKIFDIFELINIVDALNKRNLKNQISIFGCRIGRNEVLRRDHKDPHGVSYEEFPIDEIIPNYCYGAGYVATIDAVQKLYSVKSEVPLLPLEDVFVTGFIRGFYNKNKKKINMNMSELNIGFPANILFQFQKEKVEENVALLRKCEERKVEVGLKDLPGETLIELPKNYLEILVPCLWNAYSKTLPY